MNEVTKSYASCRQSARGSDPVWPYQRHHAAPRRLEAARHVEPLEIRREIDVEPFRAGVRGLERGAANELGSDAPAAVGWKHRRLQQERVRAAVPRDVNESDEHVVLVERADVGHAP